MVVAYPGTEYGVVVSNDQSGSDRREQVAS